MPNNHPRQ